MQSRRRSMRMPLGVVDSAVSSASNFLLSGLALALLDTREFAVVSLLQAAHVILLAVNRSVFFEPFLIRLSTRSDSESKQQGANALSLSSLCSLILAVVVVFVGVVLDHWAIVAFGAGIPVLAVADSIRFLSFADRSPRLALRVDTVWFVLQVVMAGVVVSSGWESAWVLIGIWVTGALGGVISATSAVAWSPVRSCLDAAWFAKDRDLRPGLVLDALSARAAPAGALFLVAAILPVEDVALVAGPRSMFGPFNVVVAAALSVGLAAAANRRSAHAHRRLIQQMGVGLTAVVALVAAVLVLSADFLGDELRGVDPDALRLRIGLTALALVAVAWSTTLGVSFRSMERTTEAARIQATAGALLIAGSTIGAVFGGAVGVLIGQAAARWLGTFVWATAGARLRRGGERSDVSVA